MWRKIGRISFWWKIWQIVFFFFWLLAFGSILFLLGCDTWKMDALVQRPLGPTFSILNFPKKFWWKLKSSSFHHNTIWEVLMKIEGIHAISMPGWTSCSPLRSKRVKIITVLSWEGSAEICETIANCGWGLADGYRISSAATSRWSFKHSCCLKVESMW